MKNILSFLTELAQNNNRDWFQANKKRYQDALATYTDMVNEILTELRKSDPRLEGLAAKDAIFRIYKDIRFSKDKTPYKTHFGAFMAKGGRKTLQAGYYIQISPTEAFIAAGSYMPEKDQLYAMRQEIAFNPEPIRRLLADKNLKEFSLFEEDKLKTGPKGFPKDHPAMDLICNRHFILSRDMKEAELLDPAFIKKITAEFRLTVPFVSYLNEAMEYSGNE